MSLRNEKIGVDETLLLKKNKNLLSYPNSEIRNYMEEHFEDYIFL